MPAEFTVEVFNKLYTYLGAKDIDQNYQGLSYISWATAWKALLQSDPDANYEIMEKPDGGIVWEEYGTFLVKTKVKAFNKEITMHLPIMDANHNAVKLEPYEIRRGGKSQYVPGLNSRILNDNIMRCLAKNIAMFGIGLFLYVKEDVPTEDKAEKEQSEEVVICNDCGNPITSSGKLSAKKIIDGTMKTYGVPLCSDCGHKRKEKAE